MSLVRQHVKTKAHGRSVCDNRTHVEWEVMEAYG